MCIAKACYLYCLAPASRLGSVESAGIDGRSKVHAGTFGEVRAVWSEVEVEEFCGEAAEARLADVAWVGPRAVRHEKVIEQAMRQSPVLPARFATLFRSLDSLNALIAGSREAIEEFFAALGDTREWSVKGCLDRARARDRFVAEWSPLDARLSPGARYMREKRILAEADRMVGPWLADVCGRASLGLREGARGFRERPAGLPSPEPGIEVIVNWAFLVAPESEAEFARLAGRLRRDGGDHGLDFSLTGPWPAYTFAPSLTIPGLVGQALTRNAP